ncbi:hypothetical protein O181_087694 [Austropuccinia psidii MF-1]|uniref:Uncharacterized protein n=1 Tax=Austropuccinia psidii MF-1 TaxID=1389203 RepID=A0A9Q3IQ76_9BASI|nr:hypothetical protein [Austropuccinia psidii MF-1]
MGLILLTCLNLPPKLRHKPAYSLVFGIIPGPNSPNTVMISNILKHLVAQLLELKDGVHIPMFLYPDGKYIYLQLLPLIGDLVAVHKASGVASHSANHFCPWCTAQLPDLQLMRQGEMRNGLDILKSDKDWKDSKTLSQKNEFCKKTGVRWFELNNLPYRNPNMHLALGILHNWLEGVLAEHFRFRWGFQDEMQEKKRGLKEETRKEKKRCLNNHEEDELGQESDGSQIEDDFLLGQGMGGGLFTGDDIKRFQYLLEDLVLPTGIGKGPKTLGAAKNGRLKASDWLTLFTLVIPLIILEIVFEGQEAISPKLNQALFLQNTGDLVQCTRIACTKAVREGHAGRFANAYSRYTQSSSPIIITHYTSHYISSFGDHYLGWLSLLVRGEIHGTLMRRVNGMQRLLAGHPEIEEIFNEERTRKSNGKYNMKEMEKGVYAALTEMLQSEGVKLRFWNNFPHPLGSFILSCFAWQVPFTKYDDKRVSTMPPNNVIFFKHCGNLKYAMVKGIFEFRGASGKKEVVIHLDLIAPIFWQQTYKPGELPYYAQLLGVVVGQFGISNTGLMIRPSQVQGNEAYRHLPPECFGIFCNGIIVCPHTHHI